MPESFDHEIDRYLRGDLTPRDARELAQAALDRPGLFEDLTLAGVALHGVAAQPSGDVLESYVAGRATAPEQRELAQAALADDALFDALAAHGAVEKSLASPAFQRAVSGDAPQQHKVVSFPRRYRMVAIAAVAAAVAALALYLWKPAVASHPGVALSASLDPAAGKPTLLARDLVPAAISRGSAPIFRSAEPDSRAPQPEGSILALDNSVATINVGSLDGVARGAQFDVVRGPSKQPIGRLEVETVFRDRARGSVRSANAIQVNDRVLLPASAYLPAVVEHLDSLADRGDTQAAREIARDALAWARSNDAPAAETRKILEHLAPLDFKTGDQRAAEQDFQSLADSFNSAPPASTSEQDATFNAWGALLLLRGDTAGAAAKFRQTRDADGLNNAAVLAELRGETANAQALYEAAIRALDKSPSASPRDRQTIEENLARVAQDHK